MSKTVIPGKRTVFLGIDPGISGAVAAVSDAGIVIAVADTPSILVKKGPKNRNVYMASGMVDILADIQAKENVRAVALENVHAMPGQGVTSMFSMGMGFGIWLGILAALKLPHDRIEPVVWKRAMGIPSGTDKSGSVTRALQLFPEASRDLQRKKDHGRAEALLLAEYLRRTVTAGLLPPGRA